MHLSCSIYDITFSNPSSFLILPSMLLGLHSGHSTCMHAVPSTVHLVSSNIAILYTERKSQKWELYYVHAGSAELQKFKRNEGIESQKNQGDNYK